MVTAVRLDNYYRSSPPRPQAPERLACPQRLGENHVELGTGLLAYDGCYSQRCHVCLRTIAWRLSRAIGLARPDQHVLLTHVGESWGEIRDRVNAFRRILDRARSHVESCYHVESNPSGRGNHVHLWSHGAHLEEHLVRDAAARSGLGQEAGVEPRRHPAGSPLSYGLKTILESPVRDAISPEVQQFLQVNGGRLCHASRNFWRDSSGARIAGVRAAMTEASRGGRSGDWLPVHLPATITLSPPGYRRADDQPCTPPRQARSHTSVVAAELRVERTFNP